MIEILTAQSGDSIIRQDGRLTASRFNPVREAQEWLASRGEFLNSVRTVFVLGLGSGHHVQALLQVTKAQVVVLETSLAVIEAVETYLPFDDRVHIELFSSARGLRANENVREAVKSSFVVLVHPASIVGNGALFEEARAQLLGRDWGSINWQWKQRNAPEFDRSPRIDGQAPPLTIYDLEQTELVSSSEERERILFKALRELVK